MDSDGAYMGQIGAKNSKILACQADSGSEAETGEIELRKLKLTARMIRKTELHWSMWRTG